MGTDRYEVRVAIEQDAQRVVDFNKRVLLSDTGRNDPFMVSLRNEIGYATDSLYGLNSFITFIMLDSVNDEIIGRCLLNTHPTSDDYDISAYGSKAEQIANQCKVAVFGGDLIDPAYRRRGLHSLLIKARIAWLLDRGFEYVFIPILKGNRISLGSYMRWDIEYLGSRIMQYQSPVEVEMYGKDLRRLRRQP
jgi:GNAT superfamily N-acetyltransferase